jgi:uncharacterized protein
VFFAGILSATLVGVLVVSVAGWEPGALTDPQAVLLNGISATAQFAGFGLVMWMVLRHKGRGAISDLGVFADRDWGVIVACLFVGVGSQWAFGLLVLPISQIADSDGQELVDQLDRASGAGVVLLAITAGILAPIFEELLFRGLLLRALMRRMSAWAAVVVSSVAFGAVHFLDPATIPIAPALIGLGLVSAVLAVRSGGLLRSIALHMGFNLVTVVIAIAS